MNSRRTGLALVAVLAMVGCSSSKHADTGTSTTTAPPTTSTSRTTIPNPVPTTITRPTTTTVPTGPAGAHVEITMIPTVTGRAVSLQVTVDGVVPQLSDGISGSPITGNEQLRNTRFDFGDGSQPGGSDGGDVACRAGAPLVPLHLAAWTSQTPLTHTYAHAGHYTVTYSVLVCRLGTVSRHVEVSVS